MKSYSLKMKIQSAYSKPNRWRSKNVFLYKVMQNFIYFVLSNRSIECR